MSYTATETNLSSSQFETPFPPNIIGFHSNHGIKPSGARLN